MLRLLDRRFGGLTDDRRSQIQTLALLQIEDLTDALLDFTTLADLDNWLHHFTTQVDRLTQQVVTQMGEIPPELLLKLQRLSLAQMTELIVVLPSFTQFAQLETWLDAQQRAEAQQFE